jgi:hypothetical protein
MKWAKQGLIFSVSGEHGWMNTHAQIPSVLVRGDTLRIYFATRPKPNLSLTTFIDVDAADPSRVVYVHDKPILELGKPGMFDEQGIMPAFVCEHGGQVWLYYGGWSRRTIVPYSNWTGLAVSDDGGTTFHRAFSGPVLDRTPLEVYSATGGFIYKEQGVWTMWYASGEDWIKINDRYEEYYVIKSARSSDGLVWTRDNKNVLSSGRSIEPTHRPTVFRHGQRYHMLFCYRDITDFRDGRGSYRMGYAWSTNLEDWTRADEQAGIEPSPSGWDSTMIAYPYVVNVGEKTLLFYNGNGFGQTGIGFAQLEEFPDPK